MRRFHIEYQGRWQWVWAEKLGNQLWFHINGSTECIEYKAKKNRRDGNTGLLATGEILAPMPGKIMKIIKSPGESVNIGDAILVLEAMKMEYSLESDTAGVVEAINVEEGQQVSASDVLAKVTKGENDKNS